MASEHEAKTEMQPTSAEEPKSAVERATELSDDMVQALEDGARAATEAVGRFAVTLEEALPQEIQSTSAVAKKITESAVEMADQLIHTQAEFLRKAVDSAGKSLTRSGNEN
jgi:hypothetical protein